MEQMIARRGGEQARAQRSGLWKNPDFLKLWFGETVSLFGSQVTILALPLTAVLFLHASAAQMGILGAAQTISYLLVTLIAGVWVDRRPRRPILIGANLVRAGLIGLIPLLALLDLLRIEYLIAIAFLLGTCGVLFELAYLSYVPRLVDRDELVEANSKLAGSSSMAEIGGPSVAGALIAMLSAPFALLLDAVSFLLSAASLARIKGTEPQAAPTAVRAPILAEIAVGLRETFRNRYLLAFAGEAATYNVCWNIIQPVLMLYAVNDLGLGAGMLGIILSTGSVGALVGSMVTGRAAQRFGVGRTMIASAMISNAGTLLLPLVSGSDALLIGWLGVAFFLRGVGMTGCNVQVYAVRQAVIPDELQGRVNGTYSL